MVTLSSPAQINSILGGNAPIAYDRLVLSPFTMDPVRQLISGTIKLTSTANPDMQPITGVLSVDCTQALLEIQVAQLDFYRRVRLTGPQNTSVQNIITNAQNAIELGLVTLGVLAGSQTGGV